MKLNMNDIIRESEGMFADRGFGASSREKALPRSLREGLRKQWTTSAMGCSNVLMRYVETKTGDSMYITGWDGFDALAGYTNSGFRNISITEIINSGAVLDNNWNKDVTLAEVKELFPLAEASTADFGYTTFRELSTDAFSKITNGSLEESEELEGGLITVFFDEDTWVSDTVTAVNMLETRDDEVYGGDRGINKFYAFVYESGDWQVFDIEPGCQLSENSFVLAIPRSAVLDESAPTEDDLLELAHMLPSPVLDSVEHFDEDIVEDIEWIVATGTSLTESGTTAYPAKEGLPHGMMTITHVMAKSRDEAVAKAMNNMDNAKPGTMYDTVPEQKEDFDVKASPFSRAVKTFRSIKR